MSNFLFALTILCFGFLASAQGPQDRYMLQEHPLFTLQYKPGEKTVTLFFTGKPLLKVVPATTEVETKGIKLAREGDSYIIPDELRSESKLELKVRSGKKKDKFVIEIPKP